jgi:peptide/nickel transport system substrate-binding protein
MLAAALVAVVAIGGCGSSDDNNGASNIGTPSTFTDQTPAPTGPLDEITWGLAEGEPASLDWIYNWSYGADNTIQANLCEGLWRQQPDGEITAGLATDVKHPDPLTYVYAIRSDVTFHDGKTMTADDVAFSLDRNLTADPPSYWGLWYENVKAITATGPNEVTVTLSKPDELFDTMMSTPAGYVGEKAYIEAKGSSYGSPSGGVMCTGPYKLEKWDKGSSVTIVANDAYWDPSLTPRVQRIDFKFITDPGTMANALLQGEVDGAWSPAISSVQRLEDASSGTLYMNKGPVVAMMQLASLDGPLKDLAIRQALQALIDYDGIVSGVLNGAGAPAASIAPAAAWGAASDIYSAAYDKLPPAKQNLDRAKELIASATSPPTRPIQIGVTSDDEQVLKAAQAIQSTAAGLGLDIVVKVLPPAEFTSLFFDAKAREGYDLLMNTVTVDVPDPLELYVQLAPPSPYNIAGIDNPTYVDPLEQARSETDADARAASVVKAQQSFADNVYGFPIYSEYSRVFLNNRLTGVPVSALGRLYYPWAATLGKA